MPNVAKRRRRRRLAPTPALSLDAPLTEKPADRSWTFPLLGIIAVGTLLRIVYANQPMRYDEAVTYLRFASQPWNTLVSDYAYPNNHVFHSLLVKASVSLLGDAPWAIRVPALLAGIAMIPVAFLVGKRLFGTTRAYFGAALVASSGELTLYSSNARGYTIVCLLSHVLIDIALRLRTASSASLWFAFVLTAALGSWTIPVMAYPAGSIVVWFALSAGLGDTSDQRRDFKRLAFATFTAAIVTALLYSPIIARDGLSALTRNKFVVASRWPVFFVQFADSAKGVVAGWTLGLALPVAIALAICTVVGLFDSRRLDGLRVSIVGASYVWCAALLLIEHRVPFARVWLFMLAPAALLTGCGLVALLFRFSRAKQSVEQAGGEFALLLSMALAALVLVSHDVPKSVDTGTLADAAFMARDLSPVLRPGDRVVAPVPSNAPLEYYFRRQGIDTVFFTTDPGDSASVYLVVNTAEGFTTSTRLAEPFLNRFTDGVLVARYSSAELYRLRHRGSGK